MEKNNEENKKGLLTEEEIARIFAMYPATPVLIFDGDPTYTPVADYVQGVRFVSPVIYAEHTCFDTSVVKLVLTQIKDLTDKLIFLLCKQCYHIPFIKAKPDEWLIKRTDFEFRIYAKSKEMPMAYVIDFSTGAVTVFTNDRPTSFSRQMYVMQFYMQHGIAFPIYFEPGHAGNGKTPLELGIAVPGMSPIYDLLTKDHGFTSDQIYDWRFDKKLTGVDLYDLKTFNNVLGELQKKNLI